MVPLKLSCDMDSFGCKCSTAWSSFSVWENMCVVSTLCAFAVSSLSVKTQKRSEACSLTTRRANSQVWEVNLHGTKKPSKQMLACPIMQKCWLHGMSRSFHQSLLWCFIQQFLFSQLAPLQTNFLVSKSKHCSFCKSRNVMHATTCQQIVRNQECCSFCSRSLSVVMERHQMTWCVQ